LPSSSANPGHTPSHDDEVAFDTVEFGHARKERPAVEGEGFEQPQTWLVVTEMNPRRVRRPSRELRRPGKAAGW
jgi:hypothetical protein